jgi:F-type H+-transporting ATPase subunit b
MAEGATTTGTEAPSGAGFPPFKTESFPSQIFWLVITMAFLFVVLWRFAGPRIKSTLEERRGMIQKEIDAAQENRRRAEAATVAYETPLFEARERARAINNQYRERAAEEARKAEADAEATAERATQEAEARLTKIRAEAKTHIANAAKDAAVEIVAKLTGERISDAEAARAIQAAQEA